MEVFLTSSPCIPEAEEAIINPANGFLDKLRWALPEYPRVLTICSNPVDHDTTVFFANIQAEAFREAGIPYGAHCILDGTNPEQAEQLIDWCDFIILSGGHVPTQNAFFREIGLRELLSNFDGVIMGISAGSMNSAEIVYAQPENEGESIDPEYERFLPGLGLTQIQILPHYNTVRDNTLDGRRLYEDITFADSYGNSFLVLPDGSYLHIHDGQEELLGEAWDLTDGVMTKISVNLE